MEYSNVLIRPVLSEKNTKAMEEKFPQYAFWVNKRANKAIIKKAISEYFNVKPLKIRIVNVYGKWKRVRKDYGLTPMRKKAIVTLKQGEKINLFEAK